MKLILSEYIILDNLLPILILLNQVDDDINMDDKNLDFITISMATLLQDMVISYFERFEL